MATIVNHLNVDVDLKKALVDLATDLSNIRSKYASLLAKLDADAGVTDTNYASTLALASAEFTKAS